MMRIVLLYRYVDATLLKSNFRQNNFINFDDICQHLSFERLQLNQEARRVRRVNELKSRTSTLDLGLEEIVEWPFYEHFFFNANFGCSEMSTSANVLMEGQTFYNIL